MIRIPKTSSNSIFNPTPQFSTQINSIITLQKSRLNYFLIVSHNFVSTFRKTRRIAVNFSKKKRRKDSNQSKSLRFESSSNDHFDAIQKKLQKKNWIKRSNKIRDKSTGINNNSKLRIFTESVAIQNKINISKKLRKRGKLK